MILTTVNNLKLAAINTPMCNQSSFGDISLYDNKSDIKYPYCNIDVVTGFVSNFAIEYTFRLYVCDRNEPYIAYNKTEQILTQIINSLDLGSYTINYFTLDFKDQVNGVWADIKIDDKVNIPCVSTTSEYTTLENGDLIK